MPRDVNKLFDVPNYQAIEFSIIDEQLNFLFVIFFYINQRPFLDICKCKEL